jgi:CheY-like chemotaxis protein
VDDREDNRRLLRDLLVPAGFEVSDVGSGEGCLSAVSVEPPDAILLDLRMPDMDGFEVTRRLRARERLGRLVIVAVSASAFEHHREQCLEAGADDFIAKPFRLDELLGLLCRHLGLEPIYDEEAAPARPDTPGGDATPPPPELAALLDLARRGNIGRILESASRLEADGRHARFAAELRGLAERFQVKQLCQFLEAAGRRS